MPAELLNELFASMPVENAFRLLANMPNGLLARNVRRMLNNYRMALKENKWNVSECRPDLEISEDGLGLTHTDIYHYTTIRALMPVPPLLNLYTKMPHCHFYFEVEILNTDFVYGIGIGFCDRQFPLDQELDNDSIVLWCKAEICIDKVKYKFNNGNQYASPLFKRKVVGIGLTHSSSANLTTLKCFAVCNGHFLGSVDLPPKYVGMQLYPAASFYAVQGTIRTNFGKEEWKLKTVSKWGI